MPIERLPFDIVHIVLSYLPTADLPAVALVCHVFCAVATQRIFAHVRYTPYLAKQYTKIECPLALFVARPELLAHLKSLDVRALPLYRSAPHPQFTRAFLHVVARAPSLASFTWLNAGTSTSLLSAALPLLAPVWPGRSDDARVNRPSLTRITITDDSLSSSDAQLIPRLGPVEHIALHRPSTAAVRALLNWVAPTELPEANHSVQSLTLSHAYALQPDILARILAHTPALRSLAITDTLHIPHHCLFDVLRETQLQLETLAFTIGEKWADATLPTLGALRHLSIHIHPPQEPVPDRYTDAPTDPLTQKLHRNLLTALSQATLHSMTIRLSERRTLTDPLVKLLITQHGATLQRLNFHRLSLSPRAIAAVLRRAPRLEQLSAELPMDDLDTIAEALPFAVHLHTLVDTSPTLTAFAPSSRRSTQPRAGTSAKRDTPVRGMTRVQAGQLLSAGPALVNVMSQQRNWGKEYVWSGGKYETVVSMRRMRMAGH